ncbi:hypothetical protein H312_00407 [Anncaliia algerae PRA339]|uniref:AMP-dependent synthetase/ligase domain-containing protein n=1 Tax=Anncaliia algerae PRA339 TaxID=1288291 RepID=A0A059F4M4_9MICR|nr:hypothetical protein H312_00407 [Anncaliia algerae PRA339]
MPYKTRMEFDGECYKHEQYIPVLDRSPDGSSTVLEILFNRYKKKKDGKIYGTIIEGEILWRTTQEVLIDLFKIRKYLAKIINPQEILGIYAINRYEWILSEHVIHSLGCISSPLYSTFGVTAVKHVLDQTEMKTCFLSGEKADSLFNDILKDSNTFLKNLILFDSFEKQKEVEKLGINVHYLQDILDSEHVEPEELSELIDEIYNWEHYPGNDDIATICYTSGTTGLPKGVILTNKNFISTISAFQRYTAKYSYYKLSETDVLISYLPLTHIFERIVFLTAISLGGKVVFYRGNIKELGNDYKIIQPTFVAGVPRVFNVFKDKIMEEVGKKGYFTQWLFKRALQWKYFWQRFGYYTSFLDSIIFNKVKKQFGGKIRAMLSGAAPISTDTVKFLQACFSCKIFQGYGQTETTAACIVAPMEETTVDTVGIPFPQNLIKLAPIGDNKCEIWVKGENVFKGYYKNEEATKECFEDGWFKTGDIGEVKSNLFKIVGRNKEIFKTSQGEYIVPEKVENIYMNSLIEDIFIVGRSTEDYIVAIVVCTSNASSDSVIKKILDIGNKAVYDKKIPRYEIPRRVLVRRTPFTDFGEVITPTGKKKRNFLEKCLKKEIDELYSKNN